MSGPKIGELFAGYGGLGAGVQMALGGEIAWFSEFDKGPSKILGHRFPGVPNHGDITKIDWAEVEPVDILTGGSPCQDLSHAGRRAGMTEGTRSNLWVAMREAVAALRPSLVVWENVRGAYSAEATSGLVDDPRLLADTRRRDGEPVLRALGRVLGDLSDLGYDASWHGLRAADVGAPHGRFRVFVVARDTRGVRGHEALEHDGRGAAQGDWRGLPDESDRDALWTGPDGGGLTLLPTPMAGDAKAARNSTATRHKIPPTGIHAGDTLTDLVFDGRLLPTPRAGETGDQTSSPGNRFSLSATASRGLLLPTPTTAPLTGNGHARHLGGEVKPDRWGNYAAAIARWERVLGRPAPAPTMTSTKGNPQLSPVFVEWLMGLPAGWVTDVPGITRNEALKALGNGVVPQQAAAALRTMDAWSERAA